MSIGYDGCATVVASFVVDQSERAGNAAATQANDGAVRLVYDTSAKSRRL